MSPLIKAWAQGSSSWPIRDRRGGWSFGVLEHDKEGKQVLTIGQGHVEISTRAEMDLKAIEMLLKYIFEHYEHTVYLIVFSRSRRALLWTNRQWKCKTHLRLCDEIRRTILRIGRNNIVFRHVWEGLASTRASGKYVPLLHGDKKKMELISESANRTRINLLGELVTEEAVVFLDATVPD